GATVNLATSSSGNGGNIVFNFAGTAVKSTAGATGITANGAGKQLQVTASNASPTVQSVGGGVTLTADGGLAANGSQFSVTSATSINGNFSGNAISSKPVAAGNGGALKFIANSGVINFGTSSIDASGNGNGAGGAVTLQ